MENGRYGAVFSQQGIPIQRANDYQKAMDSRWKFLNIHVERYIDVTFNMTGHTTGWKRLKVYGHTLPYAPAFEVILSSMSVSSDAFLTDPGKMSGNLRSFPDGIHYTFFWDSGFNTNTVRIKGFLRVFKLDLREIYKAPSSVLTTAKPQPNARYGAKFLDPNRGGTNINDNTPRSYSLYTPAKQISMHMHGTIKAVAGVVNLVHEVGYPPSYMLCSAYSKSESAVPSALQDDELEFGPLFESYAKAKATADTILFQGVQTSLGTRRFGYVILKDPVEIIG